MSSQEVVKLGLLERMGRIGRQGDSDAADDLVARDLRLDEMIVDPGERTTARQAEGAA